MIELGMTVTCNLRLNGIYNCCLHPTHNRDKGTGHNYELDKHGGFHPDSHLRRGTTLEYTSLTQMNYRVLRTTISVSNVYIALI